MYGEAFFYQAFIYLASAVIAVPIAKRLGLGSVLGYLIAGVAIGPFGLRLEAVELGEYHLQLARVRSGVRFDSLILCLKVVEPHVVGRGGLLLRGFRFRRRLLFWGRAFVRRTSGKNDNNAENA